MDFAANLFRRLTMRDVFPISPHSAQAELTNVGCKNVGR